VAFITWVSLQSYRLTINRDKALALATNLSPDQIPSICREYAQQLEVKGEYQDALRMYQRSLEDMKVETKAESKSKRAPAKFGTVANDEHIRYHNFLQSSLSLTTQ
jgi:protein subunit release factor A